MPQFTEGVQPQRIGKPPEIRLPALAVVNVPVGQQPAHVLVRLQASPQLVGVHDVAFIGPAQYGGRDVDRDEPSLQI